MNAPELLQFLRDLETISDLGDYDDAEMGTLAVYKLGEIHGMVLGKLEKVEPKKDMPN